MKPIYETLNDGLMKKYMMESIISSKKKQEVNPNDLFMDSNKLFEALDGKSVSNKKRSSKRLNEGVRTRNRKSRRLTESSSRSSFLSNLKRTYRYLTEAKMSDEDKKDSDLLRSIYDKTQNRSNAKLTKEEKDVLKKYDLTRANKNIYKNGTDDSLISYGDNFGIRDSKTRQLMRRLDKINLADKARKYGTRQDASEIRNLGGRYYWDSRDPYSWSPDDTFQDKERKYQNLKMREPVDRMKQDLKDRRYYQNDIDNINYHYDRKRDYLQRELDNLENERKLDAQFATSRRDAYQRKVDDSLDAYRDYANARKAERKAKNESLRRRRRRYSNS